jgi:16S rRNA (cytosine1402-N4)-methyltransferase
MKAMNHQINNSPHIPVLLDEVLQYLDPKAGDRYLDLTAGYGGHARKVLEKTKTADTAVLVDRDKQAIAVLQKEFSGSGSQIVNNDFLASPKELLAAGERFDLILADLGVSSVHLNNASRGFSINSDGPLDMRMDQDQGLTAEEVVNTYSKEDLARILRDYGEEPKSTRIAGLIVENRPLQTTHQLANIAAKAWPGHSKVHPATRTFQAIRIAVNDELAMLKQAIPLWTSLLKPKGRIAIISFHSLEDRAVKQALSELAGDRYDAELRMLTKHPVQAGAQEIALNPRARSAKLRAAVKIKT